MIDLKEEVEKRLTGDAILQIYSEVTDKKEENDGDVKGLCPFHGEKNQSFVFNTEKLGLYNCFSCKASGNIYNYVKEIKKADKPLIWLADYLGIDYKKHPPKKEETKRTIDPKIILKAKENLWNNNPDMIDKLVSYGISEATISKLNLGYMVESKGRYKNPSFYIPIKDESGDFVNIRKYNPWTKDPKFKVISHSEYIDSKKVGFGKDRLYPISALNNETIYIFEGEKDTLVARSNGLNGLTNTAGSNSWNREWGRLFKNKNVIICMDADAAGRDGAQKRAKNIYPYAAQIKIIDLPLDHEKYKKGDFTDYITGECHTKDDFLQLVEDADVYVDGKETDENEYKVILAEASKSKYIGKKCYIQNVLCCGKDQSPFGAPKTIEASCTNGDKKDSCQSCRLLDSNSATKTLSKYSPFLLDLIRDNKQTVYGRLKNLFSIPKNCTKYKMDIHEYYNIEKIRIVPDITYNIEEDFEQVYRVGYYVTDDDTKIDTNKGYDVRAITVLDTKTQYIQHLIYGVESSQTNIDDFYLSNNTIKKLKKFQVKENENIDDKLNNIYKEFSLGSHIYGRKDAFLLMDLVYHSAITFDFQNKSIGKGWVEGCIVGDTGQGKSTMTKFMRNHYRAGEIVSGESCSFAGLVGGLSQVGGNWQLQWGRLPLNDRRMVCIEEASGKGTSIEMIAQLSEIRSEGEARIVKVTAEATRSRNRLLWLANPRRDNLGIKNYAYGVQTVKEIFGQPEDIRRVDIAMTVASGEVDDAVMNTTIDEEIVNEYDSDSCHSLIMFAWSRKSKDIKIDREVEKYILKKSIELSKKYNPSIPLVEPADIRNKIARLTVSLAIRLFSVDENNIVRPTKDHVDYICNFLNKLYDKPRFAYNDYSKKEFAKINLLNKQRVAEVLHLNEEGNVEDLLQSAVVSKSVIRDCINSGDIDLAPQDKAYRNKIKLLKRSNAIEEHDRNFVLMPGFIDFLKKLKTHVDSGEYYEAFFVDKKKVLSDGLVMD